MAQAGYTPIQLYYSTTASAAPSSGNLANGELAINITDGKLYYKDNGGTVRVLAGTGGTGVVAGSNTQVQFNNNGVFGASSGLTWDGTNLTASQLRSSGLTSGRVTYASTSGLLVDSANMTFNGTRLTVADLADSGLTSGRVVYSTAGGALVDSANLLYSGTDLTVYGITVGRGAGAVSTNTAVGASALAANTSGAYNTAVGTSALSLTQGGSFNTGLGWGALASNVSGAQNTAVGQNALYNNTGDYNTAVGRSALLANTSGGNNVAVGREALISNTTASNNTAVGYQALYANTTGTENQAFGAYALDANTTGSSNSAFGLNSLGANTTASNNAAYGVNSLRFNTTGTQNTAIGADALQANTTASQNTAVGYQAGVQNTTGVENTYLGYRAGYTPTSSFNTIIGSQAGRDTTTGSVNTFIGAGSGYQITTGSKNTILGPYNGNQGGLDIRTLSNYIVLSDGDGYPAFWGKGGSSGYMKLEAGRLEFPATQNASSNANTLDDYEEGTWTPTIGSTGNCSSISVSSAVYTKVGRLVNFYITGSFTVTASGTATYISFSIPFAQNAGVSGASGTFNYGNTTNNLGQVIEWDTGQTNLGVWLMATNNIESGSGKAFTISGTYTAS